MDEQEKPLRSDVGQFGMVPLWLLSAGLSSRAIHLFAIMAAKYADRDRMARPKRSALAEHLSCSTDSVDRALQELVAAHALKVTRRQLPSGDYTSSLYQLCFAEPKGGGRTDAARGGRTDAARGGGTGAATGGSVPAATVAAPVPLGGRTDAETGTIPIDPDVHTPRARGEARQQGSLIARGENLGWARSQDKAHQSCHPEICKWRGTTKGICMPAMLVPRFAEKLIGIKPTAAIADVIAWAQNDSPPPGTVATGDDFKHWRERWDATRSTPAPKKTGPGESSTTVPGVAETDALLAEMTGGRLA